MKPLHRDDLPEGTCIDCGIKMPGFDEWRNSGTEDLPEGWRLFSYVGSNEPMAFQCPECDAKEQE